MPEGGRAADRSGVEGDLERHGHRCGELVEKAEHDRLRLVCGKAA